MLCDGAMHFMVLTNAFSEATGKSTHCTSHSILPRNRQESHCDPFFPESKMATGLEPTYAYADGGCGWETLLHLRANPAGGLIRGHTLLFLEGRLGGKGQVSTSHHIKAKRK